MIHPVTSTHYNERQWQAVTFAGFRLLIVAGPGTGKTHTLTGRMAYWKAALPPGEKMVAITFTIKAARDLRERLERRGLEQDSDIFVGTFHQYCWQLLRQHAPEWRDFQIADEDQIEELAGDLWKNLGIRQIRERLDHISRWKAVDFADPNPPGHVQVLTAAMREQGLLDFDDILCEAYYLLKKESTVYNAIVQDPAWVFVDEYQDINPVQHALLKIWVRSGYRLTAIGDPDQAIYGFRGSDLRFFYSFREDFSGAEVLTLSENYRSAANLLEASGQILRPLPGSEVTGLTARIYQDGNLVVHSATSERAEAEYVVRMIEKLVGGTSLFSQDSGRVDSSQDAILGFGDFVVLYRLHSQAHALLKAFSRSGIPCHCVQKVGNRPRNDLDVVCPTVGESRDYPVEKVMLMTIHAAKGLEFPAVFIVGCEDHLLPLNLSGLMSDVGEERRLFYVAMTRAKTHLFLVHARKRVMFGQFLTNAVSPFVLDIEEKLRAREVFPEMPKRKKTEEQLSFF